MYWITCVIRLIKADKREIKDFPKLPSVASFICKTLYKTVPFFQICLKKEVDKNE